MTEWQKQLLKAFKDTFYLEKEEMDQLARSLNITYRRVAKWFKNKRRSEYPKGSTGKSKSSLVKYYTYMYNILYYTCMYDMNNILYYSLTTVYNFANIIHK